MQHAPLQQVAVLLLQSEGYLKCTAGREQLSPYPMQRNWPTLACRMKLGDTVPNFEADTTRGRIKFHDFVGDSWTVRLGFGCLAFLAAEDLAKELLHRHAHLEKPSLGIADY
jgi:hypothetical protein